MGVVKVRSLAGQAVQPQKGTKKAVFELFSISLYI